MSFLKYLIIFLVGLIGVYVGRSLALRRGMGKRKNAYNRATTAVEKRKHEAKDKILTLFAKQERITNNDVEKLLDVSDATATRCLQELEDEGVIQQHGKEGRGVFYTSVKLK